MASSNFYLYDSRSSLRTLIVLHFRYSNGKLIFSTRQKVLPKQWNAKRQRVKESSSNPEARSINQILSKIEIDISNIHRDLILSDITPSNNELRSRLRIAMKIDSPPVKSPQNTELDFIGMMDKWIVDLSTIVSPSKLTVFNEMLVKLFYGKSVKFN